MENIVIISKKIYLEKIIISGNNYFWISKRFFDIFICLLLFPLLLIITIALYFLNIFYNKGAIFFVQKRMGKNCKAFNALKFRTMVDTIEINRKHSDPLEYHRITSLGRILRKLRIDELPQILNVIKGDMSLIGPRPDYYDHALLFVESIPGYNLRHVIRPGISGLSQIRLGYAEGIEATKKKSKVDRFYIENANFYLDLKIFLGTIYTIFMGRGL
jgi:lipopolysaccharide/colanic/teichoic acid biosynthesis glycosyltransferase